MILVYPEPNVQQNYYDQFDPYCCLGCSKEENCDPSRCELLQQEMVELGLGQDETPSPTLP